VSEPATVCQRQSIGKLGFEQDHWRVTLCQHSRSRRQVGNAGSWEIQTRWRDDGHFRVARQYPNCHCNTAVRIKSTGEAETMPAQASPDKAMTGLTLLAEMTYSLRRQCFLTKKLAIAAKAP